MTTAFVLAGGASLGAVQVGMLEVLTEAGIEPDLIVGSSVGALNGAWSAKHTGPQGARMLRDVWLTVRRRDVFPFSPVRIVRGLAGRSDHTVSSAPLARWLSVRAPFYQLEQAAIPLHVVATDLMTGKPVVLSTGDAVDALLASAAIPGMFPPVEINGLLLVDGGLSANTPISQAVDRGADVVYVLPTITGEAGGRPASAASVTFQAVAHLLGNASLSEIRANASRCTLYVVPAPRSIGVSPFDFRHSRELMDLARGTTEAWMASRQPVAAEQ
ncbi:MAG: patatin-like phospholipase family protein [Actinomycetota bacterium]|nr:patatin-like phospholipase family protein [Actinomycetota bacterium]